MNRRTFMRYVPLVAGTSALSPQLFATTVRKGFDRFLPTRIDYPHFPFPEDKRIPLGVTAFPVPVDATAPSRVRLQFPILTPPVDPLYFRLTAAIDFREEKVIRLYLPQSDQEVGLLMMKYAHPFQPFQTTIDARWLSNIQREGLGLEMVQGTQAAWFFLPDELPPESAGLAPQLLTGPPATERVFLQTLYSMNSFSPFGWMGGSVQDALYELHRQGHQPATKALKMHLSHYLDDQQGIILESPHTRPLDGTFNSIEDFLPFAAIVNQYPNHPSVQKAIDFCLAQQEPPGVIIGGKHLTTEGCYTVAYPLAAIALARQDAALAQIALDQLRHRIHYLVDESAVYQRATLTGEKAYRNWGRGVAWYLLGTIKTLTLLRDSPFDLSGLDEVQQSWVAAVRLVRSWQNEESLWCGYLDRPETAVDTSASAGIAAAIAWGVQLDMLPSHHRRTVKATYQSLQHYLTPDGFLTQVSQINRGGEELQESDYRVISQFGMGLMGQLKAALEA